MNAKALTDLINTLLGTESRTLARHTDEAKPFLTPRTYRTWVTIHHMGQVSQRHVQRLVALLDAIGESPSPGAFGSDVANYHYLTVESLLPLLVAEKERQIATYEAAAALPDLDTGVTAELRSLLAENRAMLGELKALAGTAPGDAHAGPVTHAAG